VSLFFEVILTHSLFFTFYDLHVALSSIIEKEKKRGEIARGRGGKGGGNQRINEDIEYDLTSKPASRIRSFPSTWLNIFPEHWKRGGGGEGKKRDAKGKRENRRSHEGGHFTSVSVGIPPKKSAPPVSLAISKKRGEKFLEGGKKKGEKEEKQGISPPTAVRLIYSNAFHIRALFRVSRETRGERKKKRLGEKKKGRGQKPYTRK